MAGTEGARTHYEDGQPERIYGLGPASAEPGSGQRTMSIPRHRIMTEHAPSQRAPISPPGASDIPAEIPKIFVVDDECMVREGVCAMLQDAGWEVEGFSSCENFLERYRPQPSTCLVLDMHFPGMEGLELLGKLSEMQEGPPVVVMSGASGISEAVQSIHDGASDFIEKPIVAERLIASVTAALGRSRHRDKLHAFRDSALDHICDLTVRQHQIMQLVLDGQPSKNIAADLGISQRTVEKHRASIMDRTGAASIPDLARLVACSQCALIT